MANYIDHELKIVPLVIPLCFECDISMVECTATICCVHWNQPGGATIALANGVQVT